MVSERLPSILDRQVGTLLALAGILLIICAGCSGPRADAGVRPVPTPSRTPRATFTPVGGVATPGPASGAIVRGQLPPGVTVVAPGSAGASQSEGSTSLVLFATPTGQAPVLAPGARLAQSPLATPPLSPIQTPTNRVPSPAATIGPSPTPRPTPYVVINGLTVAARGGPADSFELLGETRQGQKLMILARTADNKWWQVCCVANQPVWVPGDMVAAQGPVEVAPILPVPPTPTPTRTVTPPPTLTPSPTPMPPFDLARGPEFPITRDDGIMVIWAKVYQGPSDNEKPLAGYELKVFRNGVDVSKPTLSHAKSSGFDTTGPAQGNYLYNLKYEMDFGGEANWEVYLARADGSRVSPISKFSTMGDSFRNLTVYLAYFLAR